MAQAPLPDPRPDPADDDDAAFTIKAVGALSQVPAADWDACAGSDNPFLSYAFLSALEDSACVAPDEGWMPQHIVLEDPRGQVVGAMPMYVKGHSYGEYVFDHGWAHAYERAGGRYYPKLLSAVPFTPVTGPRLLVRPGHDTATIEAALIEGAEQLAQQLGVVTVHVTFPTAAQAARCVDQGWLQRTGTQYHWDNHGYADFEAFLASLNSRKRKAIKKERRAVTEAGIAMHVLTGDDLRPEHWDRFYQFYRNTSDRKWGTPYLNRAFFDLLHQRLRHRVALVMAEEDGTWVAGALNLIGTDTLYGRNWGCDGRYRFLHFEACYYQAIDFAIRTGLGRVEAGAQGEHKLQRGYLPNKTYSAHFIRDPSLKSAVADFLRREGDAVDYEMSALAEFSPFRKGDGDARLSPKAAALMAQQRPQGDDGADAADYGDDDR